MDKEYQEHEGKVDGSTLYVQYAYDDTSAGGAYTKALRLKSVRYPNARLVHYTYGSSGKPFSRVYESRARVSSLRPRTGLPLGAS